MGGGSGFLGLGPVSEPKAPVIPDPIPPAVPAPSRKQDTGAAVVLGAGNVNDLKNKRTSGGGSGTVRRTRSALGTLGNRSGLNL